MTGFGTTSPSVRVAANDRSSHAERTFVVAIAVFWSCPKPGIADAPSKTRFVWIGVRGASYRGKCSGMPFAPKDAEHESASPPWPACGEDAASAVARTSPIADRALRRAAGKSSVEL
jgi:hypothetical protein